MVWCQANLATGWEMGEIRKIFTDVVQSKTPEKYLDRLEELKIEFSHNSGGLHNLPLISFSETIERYSKRCLEQVAVEYALGQWLTSNHGNILHGWTNQCFNRNITMTSRLEVTHAMLKRWIGSSSKSLTSVWAPIELAPSDEINKIKTNRAIALTSTPANWTLWAILLWSHRKNILFYASYNPQTASFCPRWGTINSRR